MAHGESPSAPSPFQGEGRGEGSMPSGAVPRHPVPLPRGGGEGMSEAEPMTRIEGLRKSFGALEVLKGIDLTVARGEVVCLIGPSGSGKSTLLRCINFLEEPTAGLVYVDGQPIGYQVDAGGRRV